MTGRVVLTDSVVADIRYVVGICRNRFNFEWGDWEDRAVTAVIADAYKAGMSIDQIKAEAKLSPNRWAFQNAITPTEEKQ